MPNHKYYSKEWVNGRWKYEYGMPSSDRYKREVEVAKVQNPKIQLNTQPIQAEKTVKLKESQNNSTEQLKTILNKNTGKTVVVGQKSKQLAQQNQDKTSGKKTGSSKKKASSSSSNTSSSTHSGSAGGGGSKSSSISGRWVKNHGHGTTSDKQKKTTFADNKMTSEKTDDKSKKYKKVASDVIKGKYDVGQKRVSELTQKGYDAEKVQYIVNKRLLGEKRAKEIRDRAKNKTRK